ncbi:MAG: radical SAM protein [Candidatus Pacearchaeota archaeon]
MVPIVVNKGYDAKIVITRKCNLKCPFCKIRRSKKLPNEITFEQWKKGIKNLEKIGVKSIQILGGEPTTLDYLEDLINFLNKKTKLFYSIQSNSTFTKERFVSLLKAGIRGYCADVNTFNFQTKKDWLTIKSGKCFKMLMKMKTAGVPYVQAEIIISKRNIKEIPFIVERLSSLGIWINIIPLHWGKHFKWEFRAEDVADEFKIKEDDRFLVGKVMNKLVKLKKRGYRIVNPTQYLENLAKINCNPIGWHCSVLARLRIDSDGSLWICNDVKGSVAEKYNILNLNRKIYKNFKDDWIKDKDRIKCPGCAWPIAWPSVKK